jgi:hypothetical protein
VTQGSVLSRGTTTTWSMATSVLIEETTHPIEINCTSVELSRDNQDSRRRIETLLRNSPIVHYTVDDLAAQIQDAKERIYAAALASDQDGVVETTAYARKMEVELKRMTRTRRKRKRDYAKLMMLSLYTSPTSSGSPVK